MRKLPEFEFACPEANRLSGDGPTLHCQQCDRDVHDLSAMTRREAHVFLEGCQGQRLCVRYEAEVGSGRLRFQPERARPSSQLRKVTLALSLGIGGLALAQVSLPSAAPAPRLGGGIALVNPPEAMRQAVEAALAEASRVGPVADEVTHVPDLPDLPDLYAPGSQLPPEAPESAAPCDPTDKVVRVHEVRGGDVAMPLDAVPPMKLGGAMAMPTHER